MPGTEHHVKIHLFEEFSLPPEIATKANGFYSRREGGKSYCAKRLAEQLLQVPVQIVAIDCTGKWWSLRLAADGKSKGRDIYILGGHRGDAPLPPDAGRVVARLAVERGVSLVLDTSQMRKGEMHRFVAEFCEELYSLKKAEPSPAATHVFFEEAHIIAPQNTRFDVKGGYVARMLGAVEDIVRMGRNCGIGCTLIDQRPASVNKDVSSQVECMLALGVNDNRDRKAIKEWVQEQDAAGEREIEDVLPGLAQGEGFFWSPSWLRKFERVHVTKLETFDSSATVKIGAGKTRAPGQITPVDVAALTDAFKAAVDTAQANDPARLRAQVATLQRELAAAKKAPPAPAPPAAPVEVEVLPAALMKHAGTYADLRTQLVDVVGRATGFLALVEGLVQAEGKRSSRKVATAPPRAPHGRADAHGVAHGRPARAAARGPRRDAHGRQARRRVHRRPQGDRPAHVGRHARAAVRAHRLQEVEPRHLLAAAALGRVRGAGRRDPPRDGCGHGRPRANFEPLPTGGALREYWMSQLGEGERRVLEVVVTAYPNAIERDTISDATQYKKSSRDTYLQKLSARKLVSIVDRGGVRAAAELFDV
jgi:hypothetical protein